MIDVDERDRIIEKLNDFYCILDEIYEDFDVNYCTVGAKERLLIDLESFITEITLFVDKEALKS